MDITRHIIAAFRMTIVTTLLLGVAYPLAITAVAQFAFADKANGQLIERNGTVVGSRIIGQGFRRLGTSGRVRRLLGRDTTRPTRQAASSGRPTRSSSMPSRQTSRPLARKTRTRRCRLTWSPRRRPDSIRTFRRPRQNSRSLGWLGNAAIAEADVRRLVDANTAARQLGFFGEPVVNVLELNLALDAQHAIKK